MILGWTNYLSPSLGFPAQDPLGAEWNKNEIEAVATWRDVDTTYMY